MLGVLSASFALAPLMLALPVGRAVDRVGERSILVVGASVMILSCLILLAGRHDIAWLVAGLILAGVGHLLCVTGEQTAVAAMTTGSSDSRFGAYTFATSLGQAVGPLLMTLGSGSAPSIAPVLTCALAFSSLTFVTSFALGRRQREVSTRPGGSASSLLRERKFRRAVLLSAIVMAAVDITLVFLPALGREVGISAAFIGWVLGARAVASMAVRTVTGRLVSALGRRAVLTAGILSAAIAFVSVAIWPTPSVLLIGAIAAGAGLGVCQPITMSLVADIAPKNQRGTAMSLRLLGNRLSVVLVPGVMGAVTASAGASSVLSATAVLLFIGFAASVRQ
ncbi:MFS transporter [Rhodococcus sp. T2V]|uniref:MFS transporter n=1 Tax=Rhodococcus sp. T2V TaxID=3034164 RepID=UPI0023E20B5A|nr:MFS transporter [Rhodococcus sp. T2V]MDF3307921.1 MFS transporter [Rhodococcus sp. T2V]